VPDPREAELGRLHERLLAGDPVAPAELAEQLLPLLRARLAGWAATIDDPHLVPRRLAAHFAQLMSDRVLVRVP
jgi:hypothetical protein